MKELAPNDRARLTTEAADWYARMRSEDVSEIDAARFRAWLAGDAARRREFEEVDIFWEELAALEQAPEITRWHSRKPAFIPRRVVFAAAATILLAIAAFWSHDELVNQYVTDVGEQRTVPLADGSIVTLNTATRIRVRYSGAERLVELVSGQANFDVAGDAVRPFVVKAAGGEVRALGTVFDVYKVADKVTVTLIEGKVAVTKGSEVTLAAGEQLSYSKSSTAIRRSQADLPRVSAWRSRQLDFDDTLLSEAIAEANRYSKVQIELDAPQLSEARISGRFEAGRNELFAEGLQTYFHLTAARRDEDRILLSR
jgi:transmembrane sensor